MGLVEMLPGRMGKAFPLLKSLRTHYGRHCEPFSGQKRTRLQDFGHTTQSQKLSEVILPEPRRSAPRTRTQTQISTCLASNHTHCSCFTKRPLAPSPYGYTPRCQRHMDYYKTRGRIEARRHTHVFDSSTSPQTMMRPPAIHTSRSKNPSYRRLLV